LLPSKISLSHLRIKENFPTLTSKLRLMANNNKRQPYIKTCLQPHGKLRRNSRPRASYFSSKFHNTIVLTLYFFISLPGGVKLIYLWATSYYSSTILHLFQHVCHMHGIRTQYLSDKLPFLDAIL
jgi:hypothetical protein